MSRASCEIRQLTKKERKAREDPSLCDKKSPLRARQRAGAFRAFAACTEFSALWSSHCLHLLAWSDNLKEIKAICHCGRKATMVLRLDEEGNAVTEGSQVEIGGNDRYVSTCRKHFKEAFFA